MKIGVLSDTHGVLPPQTFQHFKQCDELWHAGDIGNIEVATQLENFKPCKIVHGNIDGAALRMAYPHTHKFVYQGIRICITHIAGNPPHYNSYIQRIIHEYQPNILVCGHSHILRVERDKHDILYINPGAAGHYGIHLVQTILRFDIIAGKLKNMQAIEIGKKTPS